MKIVSTHLIAKRRHPLVRVLHILGALVLWAACSVSTADAGNTFRSVITFGDSLTHNDVLGLYYGNPQTLYGRDPMEAFFDKASRSGDELVSFAVAGSKSEDLDTQLAAYTAAEEFGLVRKGTLFSIEIGGNDLMDQIHRLARVPPGVNASTDRIVTRIVDAMRSASNSLRRDHPNVRFILWTLPDLTLIPKYYGQFTPKQQQNIRAHIQKGNRSIKRLALRAGVIILDIYDVLSQAVESPPEVRGHLLLVPPAWGEYYCFFADRIHPTAVGNALVANAAILTARKSWGETIPLYNEKQLAKLARIWTAGSQVFALDDQNSREVR